MHSRNFGVPIHNSIEKPSNSIFAWKTSQENEMATWCHRLSSRKKDEIICKMGYFTSNFASKVEKHEISRKNLIHKFLLNFANVKVIYSDS